MEEMPLGIGCQTQTALLTNVYTWHHLIHHGTSTGSSWTMSSALEWLLTGVPALLGGGRTAARGQGQPLGQCLCEEGDGPGG